MASRPPWAMTECRSPSPACGGGTSYNKHQEWVRGNRCPGAPWVRCGEVRGAWWGVAAAVGGGKAMCMRWGMRVVQRIHALAGPLEAPALAHCGRRISLCCIGCAGNGAETDTVAYVRGLVGRANTPVSMMTNGTWHVVSQLEGVAVAERPRTL